MRRQTRIAKAARIAPRPLKKLRPIVRCPNFAHNVRQREGRGFTMDELKGAGLDPRFAQTIGITYDKRRRNKSMESLQLNTQRLKEYMDKLILFPKKKGAAPKKLEASPEEISKATQLAGKIMPVRRMLTRARWNPWLSPRR